MFTSAGETAYRAAYDETLTHWGVPVERLAVPTPFGAAHVNACGPADAPAVVLVHGFGFSSTVWHPNAAALGGRFRVYAPDVIAQPGLSELTRRPWTLHDYMVWLAAVFDGLGLDRPHLVGQSYGGWLALAFAVRHPGRVGRLAVYAPAASFRPISWEFYLRIAAAGVVPTRGATEWFVRWMSASPPGRDVFADPAVRQFAVANTHYRQGWVPLPTVFADGELRAVRSRTLVRVGERERLYPPAAVVRRATRLIPEVDARVMRGTGHGLTVDRADAVNAELLHFLR